MLASEHARGGRLELAHELLDEFAASGFEPMPEPDGWLLTVIHYSDVAIACDDHHAAAALYERLVPYADQLPTMGSLVHPPVEPLPRQTRHPAAPLRAGRPPLHPRRRIR